MENQAYQKYAHVFQPLRVKNIIYNNRLCSTTMSTVPTHTHLSSTNYGGIGIYDKARGGVAMIGMMYHGTAGSSLYEANGADPFSKYNLDVLRESLSVVKQGGALAGLLGTKATAFSMATVFTVSCVEMNGSFITSCIVFLAQIIVGVICTKIFVGKASAVQFLAPLSGKIIPLSEVNDPVFAEKTLGDGFAIIPTDNKLYAPFDGEIVSLYPTKHAIGLKDKNNNEILIHIGIDTVNLKGEGFQLYVSQGEQVQAGQLLLEFDTQIMEDKNVDLTTPVVFVGHDKLEEVQSQTILAKTQILEL